MTSYLTKAGNLTGLTDLTAARDNLNLGTSNTPVFAGVTAQGSGGNIAQLTATSLSLTQTGSGAFTIQPSQGIVFPNGTIQTTAYPGPPGSTVWGGIGGTLSNQTDLQTALNLKAPLASPVFTGDARAVTATFGDNDTSIATTAFVQAGLLGGTAVARNLEVEVRNQSGASIPAGSIVYISGATGNKPLITLSQANNDANSAQTMGFTKTVIANNGVGFVIIRGEVENLDTSALTEGDQLYLSPTVAGAYTTTKPSAPQHLVYVGIVIRSHPTLGTILVAVQNGYELDEIHDVAISAVANNNLLAYESSTSLWKNKTFSALGLATESFVTSQGYITSAALTPYLTSATAASTYQTLAGMSSYLTTATAATTYYPLSGNPSGFLTSAPVTSVAGRTGAITLAVADVSGAAPLASPTFTGTFTTTGTTTSIANSTAAQTIAIGNGATISGATKTVNIGTGGLAGSNTTVTIGAAAGLTNVTFNTNAGTISLGGNALAMTQYVDTSDTSLATTAFVVGQAGSATPLVDGTAAVGTSLRYARQDHVHGTDTTRAPLASPTFTGTPTLPTGTIGTTQSPGDNTTALATTAFVTAAVPALATVAQTIVGTSSTTAIAPSVIGAVVSHPELRPLNYFTNTAVSGSGAVTVAAIGYGQREMYLGSLAIGRASWQYGIPGANANNMSRADWRKLDFSKKIWMSGKAMVYSTTGFGSSYPGDANTFARITLGGYGGAATGDMTVRGIGWKKQGGSAPFFTLTVHNGTIVTDVASTIAPTDNQSIDWLIYSDGTGNVTLYINGTQAATTTAGPTGITTNFCNAYREQVEAATTPAARQIMECTGGFLYIEG
jgi:hypothetical protein